MKAELQERWVDAVVRAKAWQPGSDPVPVFEALAYASVLDAVRALGSVPSADRDTLVRAARRALLQTGGRSDEDAEALGLILPLAKRGLLALERQNTGATSGSSSATAFRTHPSATDIVAMTNGLPDAFGSAAVAQHAGACATCASELELLSQTEVTHAAPLLAAAADLEPMLNPTEGTRVGVCEALHAEAIYFGDGTLAIYADDDAAVRLVAEGCVTRDMRPGYWVGKLEDAKSPLDATLYVGEESARIALRFN